MTQAQDHDDIKYNETLKKKIEKLKKKRNAVIIAHNYQRDEIQEIADISGDSLALAQAAVRTDAASTEPLAISRTRIDVCLTMYSPLCAARSGRPMTHCTAAGHEARAANG